MRSCSWTDFEISHEQFDLLIEGEDEILISGCIDVDYFNDFVSQIKQSELIYTFELYDHEGKEMTKVANQS